MGSNAERKQPTWFQGTTAASAALQASKRLTAQGLPGPIEALRLRCVNSGRGDVWIENARRARADLDRCVRWLSVAGTDGGIRV